MFALLLPLAASGAVISNASLNFGGYITAAHALVEYVGPGLPHTDPDSIFASADANAFTTGPVRPGFLEISGTGGAETSGSSFASFGDFSVKCQDSYFGCRPVIAGGLLRPFTLGVPFQVHIDASAYRYLSGSALLDVQFALFESTALSPGGRTFQGAPVLVFDPPPASDVPEPATWAMLLLGCLAFLARASGTPHQSAGFRLQSRMPRISGSSICRYSRNRW